MIKSGFWKNKKFKISPKLSNTTSLLLSMMQEDLLSLISFMNWSTVLKIINFGAKSQEQKDSFGSLIIQNSLLLCKKLVREFIISLIFHGGVRYQKNIGVKLKNRKRKLSNLFLDFGMKKLEIKEINSSSFLKIWKDSKLRLN